MAPVEVGELVSLLASVNYVGRSSLVVGIKVISENVKTHLVKHTNTSYFTMVAMNENNKAVEVPGLILDTANEIRRFFHAYHRKEMRKQYTLEEQSMKATDNIEQYIKILKNERCSIAPEYKR
jgi:acyl-CoA hydrolase